MGSSVGEAPAVIEGPTARGTASRWLRLILGVIAACVLAGLIWVALASRTVTSGADERNQADLAIAAGGLEQWSGAIAGLAQASFIRGRVENVAEGERDHEDGWQYRAWMRHPALDEFRILYAVTSAQGCDTIRARIVKAEGELPFVRDYYSTTSTYLKTVASFPLIRIWETDTATGMSKASPAALRAYLDHITGPSLRRVPAPHAGDVVCFAAGIPLDRLLVLDKAARAFSTLLIVDGTGHVVAQIGREQMPITSLNGLSPADPVFSRTLAALGQQNAALPRERRLADNLSPTEITVAGRSFVAYVRPFEPPGNADVCRAPPPPAAAPRKDAGTQPPAVTEGGVSTAAPGACLIVALAPKATVWRQVVGLPLLIGVSLCLAVLILIAMLPSLRLILLGPGESITRPEAIGVVLGIPAVTSLATLVLLFVIDLTAQRQAARVEAQAIATQATGEASTQIREAIERVRATSGRVTPASFGIVKPVPDRGAFHIVGCKPAAALDKRGSPGRNPEPACRLDNLCRYRRLSGLPVIDTMVLFDEDGRQVFGSQPAVCRGSAGGRANVSAREYFGRLRTGTGALLDSPEGEQRPGYAYVVSHVAALPDGIVKSIVASEADMIRMRGRRDRDRAFAVGTTSLTNGMAPVLPPPFGLMMVDTRDDALPVLLHPTPGRSGAETLAPMLPNPASVRQRLRALVGPEGASSGTAAFTGFYDGARRMFVARPIAGTRWVVVVHYGLAAVDAQAAATAVQALQGWAVLSIVSVGMWLLWLLVTRRRGWPRLWPQRIREQEYRGLTIGLGALAAAAGLFLLIAYLTGWPGAGVLMLVGFLVRIAAGAALHLVLGRAKPETYAPLRSSTQRSYTRMLAPLLLCLSVLPMCGFWLDARHYTLAERRQETLASFLSPDGMIATNRLVFDRLRWAYGIPADNVAKPTAATHWLERLPGAYGVEIRRHTKPTPPEGGFSFSDYLSRLGRRSEVGSVSGCPSVSPMPQPPPQVRMCEDKGQYGIDLAQPGPPGGAALFALGLFALFLFFAIRSLVMRVLRALAGFGMALGAVDHPRLFLGDLWGIGTSPATAFARLNRRSLLVNAPWVIFAMIRKAGADHRIARLDVALPPAELPRFNSDTIVIVTGMELVLVSQKRRLLALELLESAARRLAELGAQTQARMIILSEASPMERILDAFERNAGATDDAERESLRWSRLFEDFATYSFTPSRLTEPMRAGRRRTDRDRLAIVNAVLEECRWLPPRIVNGAIGREVFLSDDVLNTATLPVGDDIYQRIYRWPLSRWAIARNFPGRNAARAHLRNQLIEYYQRLWLSSTDAEHLVMHNMAHSRFVNISAAVAFSSLVRRGIVVMDPEPRLMNRSFAMFVRQAEKLGTIMEWRRSLPAGAWQTARLPIFIVIGVALVALVAAVIFSGEEPSTLLPVLAAGIPALIAAVRRVIKQ